MKYEWRKKEKSLYLPKETPTIVDPDDSGSS